LSEARKYRLSLNIAHQYISQLEENIKNAVFGNVGSMAVFRVGTEDATFLEPKFKPTFNAQDITKLDNYNAYMSMLVKGQPTKPFNIHTLPPEKGNIVFRLTDLQNDKKSLRVGYVNSNEPGIITSAYLALNIQNRLNDRYAYYLLHAYDLQKVFYGMGGGVRQTLDFHDFKYLPVTIPNIKTQEKIINYLNEKTSSIDQIINRKQKQIELLHERRTAFINYSLSEAKGELVKMKNHVIVNPTKKAVSNTDLNDTVSFVPMEAISEDGKLTLQEKRYEEVKDGFTYFKDGDVVLAKITPCYENGKAGVMKDLKNGFGFGTTEFMVLRPKHSILADYLYYLIYSDKFRKSGEVEMRGTAGQKRVTTGFVRNYEFPLPSLEIQRKIVGLLNKKIDFFDSAIKKAESSIQLLQELKSSLISNVVTGKIKV
jgi:type I restriction enzyme S subunit